jgi:hypothetical protein
MIPIHLCVERLVRSPELAPLDILESALFASEAALLAVHAELFHGTLDNFSRASSSTRAHAVLLAARRLSLALTAYREALAKEERRARSEQQRRLF